MRDEEDPAVEEHRIEGILRESVTPAPPPPPSPPSTPRGGPTDALLATAAALKQNACGLRKMRAMKSLLGPKKKRGRPKKISLPGEKLLAKAKKPAGRKRKRKPDKVVDVEDVVI